MTKFEGSPVYTKDLSHLDYDTLNLYHRYEKMFTDEHGSILELDRVDRSTMVLHTDDGISVLNALDFEPSDDSWLNQLYTLKDYVRSLEYYDEYEGHCTKIYFLTPYGVKNIDSLAELANESNISDNDLNHITRLIGRKLNTMDNYHRRNLFGDDLQDEDYAEYDPETKTFTFYNVNCEPVVTDIQLMDVLHLSPNLS